MRHTLNARGATLLGATLLGAALLDAAPAHAQNNAQPSATQQVETQRIFQETVRFILSRAADELSTVIADRIRDTLCAASTDHPLGIDPGANHKQHRINLANHLFPAVCNAVSEDLPLGNHPALTLRDGLRADLRALPTRLLAARPNPRVDPNTPQGQNIAFVQSLGVETPLKIAIELAAALRLHRGEATVFRTKVVEALRITLAEDQHPIIEALRTELANADPAMLRARLDAVLNLAVPEIPTRDAVARLVLALRDDDPVAIGRATVDIAPRAFPGAAGQLANFAMVVASAEQQDDVIAALHSFIAPVGSWRTRAERPVIGISAMLGFQLGAVVPFAAGANGASRDGHALSLAPSLNLGLQYSHNTGGGWSFRVHFQVIDLGALLRFNGYDLSFSVQELGDRPVLWSSVLSPGILVGFGVPRVPFVFGIGGSLHPEYGFSSTVQTPVGSAGAGQLFVFASTSFDLFQF